MTYQGKTDIGSQRHRTHRTSKEKGLIPVHLEHSCQYHSFISSKGSNYRVSIQRQGIQQIPREHRVLPLCSWGMIQFLLQSARGMD